MSSEPSNFSALLDVPSVRHPRICTSIQGLDLIVEDHAEAGRFACHGSTGFCLSQFPNYNIVLVVTCRKNVAAIGAKLGTSEVGTTADEIIVLLS